MKIFSHRRIILYAACDIIFIDLALVLGVALWFTGTLPGAGGIIRVIPDEAWLWLLYMCLIAPVLAVAVLAAFRLYNNLWHYAGIDEMMKIFIASTCIMLLLFAIDFVFLQNVHVIPKRSFVMAGIIQAFLCAATRLGDRAIRRFLVTVGHMMTRKTNCKRVMIVGAGYTGYNLARDMQHSRVRERIPVLFVDDDETFPHRCKGRLPRPRQKIPATPVPKLPDQRK